MSEVVIGRCELRIRRVSGWAWGASPQALLAAATRALPDLIGSRLSPIADRATGSVEVGEPVRVRITATARQLAALATGDAGVEVVQLREMIAAEVARAIDQAVAVASVTVDRPAEAAGATSELVGASAEVADRALSIPGDARRTIARWFASGALASVLAVLEEPALAALVEALLPQQLSEAAVPDQVRAIVELARRRASTTESTADRLRARLLVAAEVIARMPEIATAVLGAAVELAIPKPIEERVADDLERRAPAAPTLAALALPASFEIRTVLPFLMLSALHHAGWLASVAALAREDDARALAAGMAAKLLAPPERGWARARGDGPVIDAFTGAALELPQLAVGARRLAPVLPGIDASLRTVVTRARTAAPVVVCRTGETWRLVDTDGIVVLALGTELAEVVAHVPRDAHLFVPSHCVERATLEQLDYRNQRFVTDAAPARGEAWRSFQGIAARLQTNDTATPTGKLVAIAARFAEQVALTAELAGFFAERPAIPRGALGAFDATCELAASAALADLAARLFPAEATTPALIVQRFATLDAWVTISDDQLRVRVPSGRRHAELMRAGAFGSFVVPWFAGTYELGGS